MNAFTKFGIERLSPSSLNLWVAQPGIWALRYLASVRDDGSAAAWRGNAVERGFELLLRGQDMDEAQRIAAETFEAAAVGEVTDDLDEERARIAPMLNMCAAWMAATKPGPIAATQLKVETWLDGVSVPVIGYIDFTFMEDGEPDLDLKTTKACPSEPRPDHVRQIALYHRARRRGARLLYVTGKKHAEFVLTEDQLEGAVASLAAAGRSLERFLGAMPDTDTAVRCLPMDTSHFMFKDVHRTKVAQLEEAF